MKIAIYCRVSTEDQKVDLQIDALKQYAEARQQTIFKEYIDHISGAKDSRPALNEMMADARRRRFDAVVVWKIDRLGRSVAHLLTVLTELQSLGIAFISLQESIDTSTPAGRMVFTLMGAIAEFERGLIAERVKAGMLAAKKRGKHCGRPRIKADLSFINKLRSEGKSMTQIAVITGMSQPTVSRLLRLS